MQHLLYKTTNLLNGRFYVGMHSTNNLDDGYLGSGRRLVAEIKKYGRENFKREILEVLASRDALKAREAEIVNETLLADPLCLNLKNGGEGGGAFWSKDQQAKASVSGNRSPKRNHPTIMAKVNATKAERGSGNYFGGRHDTFTGKKLSDEHKAKQRAAFAMRGHQQGKANSQFGTCWVTDGQKAIKIKLEELNRYVQDGYIRGRKSAVK